MNTPAGWKYLRRCMAASILVAGLSWNAVAAENRNLSEKDRQEISVLIYNYSYMFDSKNLEGFLDLFSQNATWKAFFGGSPSPEMVLDTPDAFRQVFGNQMQLYAADGIQTRHFITNPIIYRTGPGLAEGSAMFLVTHQYYEELESTVTLLHTGEYRYRFVKTRTGWKFRRIEAHADHQ